MKKPSDFKKHPYDSVFRNMEHEIVARNIMVILSRTGDEFRELSWEEYKKERQKDGAFAEGERGLFDKAIKYCKSPDTAALLSEAWA
jgi:hypothetical protein